jgi:hypothetical protein
MVSSSSSTGSKLRRSAVFSLTGFALISTGCGLGDEVGPRVELVNQTQSALTVGSIRSITGTYGASCDGRAAAGTDPWTASVTGGPAADELGVRLNDADCVLTFNNVVSTDGVFIGAPAITLNTADTYKATASAYALAAGPLDFYGNAKISSLLFASDFTITLLVSDTPAVTEGTKAAATATVSATVLVGTVPAPNYTVSFTPFELEVDVDNVVQLVSGYAQLAAGSVAGQDSAVYQGALTVASTVSEIETAFAASTPAPLSGLTTLQVPATGFGLIAADLDASTQRTIIIRNVVEGVSSYQLLLITFIP